MPLRFLLLDDNLDDRLHSAEEYPGNGIGLAIVKNGPERMGGRVAVESRPDAGSAFCIDLPAPQDAVGLPAAGQ